MIVRSLDVNGDWNFGKGRNDYLTDNAAIQQNIQTRLLSFLGDCFFAMDQGVDWFNILGSKDRLSFELSVRAQIINTPLVTGIVLYESFLEPKTRLITMKYVVNTVYTKLNADAQIASNTSFLLTEDGDIITTESGDGIVAGG